MEIEKIKGNIRELVYSGENVELGFMLMESQGLSKSNFEDFVELEELTGKSIGNLINLQRLILNNNQLETLPESIGNLVNLHWLYNYNNPVKSLPESISNLVNLQWLFYQNNI